MKRRSILTSSLLAALSVSALLTGCFAQREEVVQRDSASYIFFSGNVGGTRFSVEKDGLDVWQPMPIEEDERYTLPPGVYGVVVERHGRVVVRRKLFLSDGQAFEVRVP